MNLDVVRLEQCAARCLSNYNYQNAMFYADLIRAQNPDSEDLTVTQADIQLKCNDHSKALQSLKSLNTGLKTLRSKLIFAKCCQVLRKFDEFRSKLVRWTMSVSGCTKRAEMSRLSILSRRLFVERSDAEENFIIASLFEIIGNIYLDQFLHEFAAEAFRLSLRADPTSISCIEASCDLLRHRMNIEEVICQIPPDTEEKVIILDKQSLMGDVCPGEKRKLRRMSPSTSKRCHFSSPSAIVLSPNPPNRRIKQKSTLPIIYDAPKLRHTSSDFGSRDSVKENATNDDEAPQRTHEPLPVMVTPISQIVTAYARAYHAFSRYDLDRAMDLVNVVNRLLNFKSIHRVILLTARIQFEQNKNDLSAMSFELLLREFPSSLEGLEYYGTVLWRKRDKVALTSLSHQLGVLAPHHPVTWCAIGNCMSALGDTTNSIKMFKRALAISKSNVQLQNYVLTLLASEYLDLRMYREMRNVLKIVIERDPLCYRAYMIYAMASFNQHIYSNAIYFFQKANLIHPRHIHSATNLAIAYYKVGKINEALDALEHACEIDPHNRNMMMHRAGILMMTNQAEKAHDIMKQLIMLEPQNNAYHYLMAKIYKIKDEHSLYVKHLNLSECLTKQRPVKDFLDSVYDTNQLALRFGELTALVKEMNISDGVNRTRIMRITNE